MLTIEIYGRGHEIFVVGTEEENKEIFEDPDLVFEKEFDEGFIYAEGYPEDLQMTAYLNDELIEIDPKCIDLLIRRKSTNGHILFGKPGDEIMILGHYHDTNLSYTWNDVDEFDPTKLQIIIEENDDGYLEEMQGPIIKEVLYDFKVADEDIFNSEPGMGYWGPIVETVY